MIIRQKEKARIVTLSNEEIWRSDDYISTFKLVDH